jgi:hypothetical protein
MLYQWTVPQGTSQLTAYSIDPGQPASAPVQAWQLAGWTSGRSASTFATGEIMYVVDQGDGTSAVTVTPLIEG